MGCEETAVGVTANNTAEVLATARRRTERHSVHRSGSHDFLRHEVFSATLGNGCGAKRDALLVDTPSAALDKSVK